MTAALYAYAYLSGFFCLYVLVMALYRVHLKKLLRWNHYVLVFWAVIAGFVVDVLSNIFVATLVFWDWPKEWMVTTRLQRYKNSPEATAYQKWCAEFLCEQQLDIFDPTENHC